VIRRPLAGALVALALASPSALLLASAPIAAAATPREAALTKQLAQAKRTIASQRRTITILRRTVTTQRRELAGLRAIGAECEKGVAAAVAAMAPADAFEVIRVAFAAIPDDDEFDKTTSALTIGGATLGETFLISRLYPDSMP
jgi:hypothetical protein